MKHVRKNKKDFKIKFTVGCGNIYEDFGFVDAKKRQEESLEKQKKGVGVANSEA